MRATAAAIAAGQLELMEEKDMAGRGEATGWREHGGCVARVLIVDDDEAVRGILQDLLESDGRLAVAGHAEDGDEAVEAVARLRPDAVILDHQMPGRTGLEALPELRRCAPDAVIVMVSGAPDAELARHAAEAGADAYFRKGTRLLDVVGLIGGLLDGDGRRGPADALAPAGSMRRHVQLS